MTLGNFGQLIQEKIFADPEFSQRFRSIILASSWRDWLKWSYKCFLPCCRAIASAWQMTKKWRSYQFLDTPLFAI
ncbi:MAG: hypothetical protein D6756_02935 [Cyanobacteria bacterium J083]|nr:MAG: hypothetical protein D6756_02935 [Cyanobacteria bacterium J083]